jgi:hypothetical protein
MTNASADADVLSAPSALTTDLYCRKKTRSKSGTFY